MGTKEIPPCDVYISYRRDKDAETAKRLRDVLTGKGYRAFCDAAAPGGGFDPGLLGMIENCTDFLIVLSPGALDRGESVDEWLKVRMELSCALRADKNVIPLIEDGFRFPDDLPKDLAMIRQKKEIRSAPANPDAVAKELAASLKSRQQSRPRGRYLIVAAVLAAAALAAAGLWKSGVFRRPEQTTVPPETTVQAAVQTTEQTTDRQATQTDVQTTDRLTAPPTTGPFGETAEETSSERTATFEDAVTFTSVNANMMMSDANSAEPPLHDGYPILLVFNSNIPRREIRTITFLDTIPEQRRNTASGQRRNAMDISQGQNNTVMAWTTERKDGMLDLVIGAEGGVIAPENCAHLFEGYTNVTSIAFRGHFDTSHATSMEALFAGCSSLRKLDLSGFDMSGVRSISRMFDRCARLEVLSLCELNTADLTQQDEVFNSCGNLKEVYYHGQKEQWQAGGLTAQLPGTVTVHFE